MRANFFLPCTLALSGKVFRFGRIFRNLIDNALKYGEESLTWISIGYEDSESIHIFSVSDNGKGLKGADSEKIFEVFQRDETSMGGEGAGLGLAIVKEIAEKHGGRVWVEPGGKKGITFYVSISKNLRALWQSKVSWELDRRQEQFPQGIFHPASLVLLNRS